MFLDAQCLQSIKSCLFSILLQPMWLKKSSKEVLFTSSWLMLALNGDLQYTLMLSLGYVIIRFFAEETQYIMLSHCNLVHTTFYSQDVPQNFCRILMGHLVILLQH